MDATEGETLFLAELRTIEQAIAYACRRAGLRHADAEDFASYVKVRLIENEYATVRKYKGQCNFAGYISIVVQRMLLDYRIHLWGKWHASSEARRLGADAVALESLILRDGLTLDEAVASLCRRNISMTRSEAGRIAAMLPARLPRRRIVDLDALTEEELCTREADLDGPSPFEHDRTASSRRLGAVIRRAIDQLPDSERLLFRLRFEAGMSIADIARTMQTEPKPLYRRIGNLVAAFRKYLEAAGINLDHAAALIGDPVSDLDFGFRSENSPLRPSSTSGAEEESEEAR